MLTIGEAPHSLAFIAAAVAVCLLASWAAFGAIQSAPAGKALSRRAALTVGVSIGLGVWSTHFVAMLGIRPDFALAFSAPETFASILPAVFMAGGGLALAASVSSAASRFGSACFSGLGVSVMHHLGMMGLSGCLLTFNPLAVTLATLATVGASVAATRIVRARRRFAAAKAATIFSLGVAAVHFGSVAGTSFRVGAAKSFVISAEVLSILQIASALVIAIPLAMFVRRVVAHAREAQLTGEVAMATGEGVAIMDREGRLTWANQALVKMYGVPADDVMGASTVGIVRRHADAGAASVYASAIASGDAATIEVAGRAGDGERLWVEVRLIPRRNVEGALTGFVSTHRDVTAEKLALEELERSRAEASRLAMVAEHASDAILITDEAGRATWVNPGFVRMTGYGLEDVEGRKPGEILQGADTDPAAAAELGRAVRERRPAQTEIMNYTRGGEPYWIDIMVTPVEREGEETSFIAVSRDMTERVRRERQLAEMRRRAEEADRLKSEFLARMSHEIRTPMNGVSGLTELLTTTDLDEMQGVLVAELRKSSDRLLRLVDDILDFAAIEEGRIALRPAEFDMRALADEVIALISPRAQEKGVTLLCSVSDQVGAQHFGDDGRLHQVLLNLLSNAIAFTDAGEVELKITRLGLLEGEGGAAERLCLEVRDTGVGIPLAAQKMIFERFRQAEESARRTHEGAGLGLSIVKAIVEAMGGDVAVTSKPGAGSTFRVDLALDIRREAAA